MGTVKLTYGQIIASTEAINTLMTSDNITYGTGLKIQKNAGVLQKFLEEYQTEEKKLIDKYYEKDEEGNLVQAENGGYKLKGELINEYVADRKTLDNFEVEARLYKLSFDDVKDVKIKPILISTIDYMIEGLPDEE